MKLPRALLKLIAQRAEALQYEAKITGRTITSDEARRQAVAEIVHTEKIKRGLLRTRAEQSWAAGKQALELLTKDMEGVPPATPSPELEAEVASEIVEFEAIPHSQDEKSFWSKIHHYAKQWASSYRNPSRPTPPAPTVSIDAEPVAEPRPAPKRVAKRIKEPPAQPPANRPAPPLIYVSGPRPVHWIGGEVHGRNSYGR